MLPILLVFLITIEYRYSLLKNDDVYTPSVAKANIYTYLVVFLKDVLLPSLSVVGAITLFYATLPHLSTLPTNPLTYLLCFIVLDFFYYVFHKLSHSIPVLWALHFVHHGDPTYNLSLGFRASWFEIVTMFFVAAPLVMLGFPFTMFLVVFSISSTYQFLCHARYVKLPRFIEYVFVTPRYHFVHHDHEIRHQNSNFGGVFTFWDRLFSTHVDHVKNLTFGIKGYHQTNVLKMQTDPIIDYCKQLAKLWK
jgi:sterol desaturase/sphingolipid hydroxylase (fatty acid hydroxylase superfamily)